MSKEMIRSFALALLDLVEESDAMRAELEAMRVYRIEREEHDRRAVNSSVSTAFETLSALCQNNSNH